MTVQDIINDTTNDIRQVLNGSTDAAILIPWVNRIQKDALHTSLFNTLLQNITTVNVVSGTSLYTIPSTTRRIVLLYDRTFDRVILPIDNLIFPASEADAVQAKAPLQIPEPMLTPKTMQQWPEYYRREGTTGLVIFPAPQKAAFNGTYEVHYEAYSPDLVNLTDVLLIPNDGKDLIVAGVNMLACQYLKLDQEVGFWAQQYELLKKGAFVQ